MARAAQRFLVKIDGRERLVELEAAPAEGGGKLRVTVDGRERTLEVRRLADGGWSLVGGTEARLVDVDGAAPKLAVEVSHPDGEPRLAAAEVRAVDGTDQRAAGGPAAVSGVGRAAGPLTLQAPIPGKIAKVLVRPGERAAKGQPLLVIEAMKMENELRAPREAVVSALHVAEGNAVETGQDLVVLD
jgi:biotin carboxyl carrier protein